MESLTFRSRTSNGSWTYQLTATHVRLVGGTRFGNRSEHALPVDQLLPDFDRIWSRSKVSGWWIAGTAASLAIPFGGIFYISPLTVRQLTGLLLFPAVIALAGVCTQLFGPRREYVRFLGRNNGRSLTIAKSGPDSDDFERFVRAVETAVRERGATAGSTSVDVL